MGKADVVNVVPSPSAFVVNGEVLFDPHPGRQTELLQLLTARVWSSVPAPANIFVWGNRGSGKSKALRMFAHACAAACPGFKYAIVRRNLPDLRKNHTIYVGKEMRALSGDFNTTWGQANYHNGSIGFYSQCETEQDAEKIVGAEVALLIVDEAPQIKWELLRLLGPSLRVPKSADGVQPYRTLVIYSGNPVGESIEELWQYFVDQTVEPWDDPEYAPADFLAFELRRADNPSIDEEEYRKQFAGLPTHYRLAWLDGVRMDARTLFDVQPIKDGKPYHYLQELPRIDGVPLLDVPWIQIYRAFDMGFFPDPAVCVWFAVVGRRVIAFHEETWFRTIAKDLAALMQQTTRELVGDTPVVMTYVDPEIAITKGDTITVMDTLEMAGVPCEPSINDRILYADAIHSLLGEEVEPGTPRFQVYEPGCPMLAKYLPKMNWDPKHPRKMADHRFDHWPVCVAYYGISTGTLAESAAEKEGTRRPAWMDWLAEGRQRRRVPTLRGAHV